MIYLEIFGYIGTITVLLSMMMTSVVKLRVFNLVGSVISMIYAFLSGAFPVVFLNLGLILINAYQLILLGKTKAVFTRVKLNANDNSLAYFLEANRQDIARYFPQWSMPENALVYMVYNGAEAAGVLIGSLEEDRLDVALDYTSAKYRDCSVAAYLMETLKEDGIKKVFAQSDVQEHIRYLQKMGFAADGEKMIKEL